ncbi:MAG: AGE family epimerase/isomerase [Clostridiales bacterium]
MDNLNLLKKELENELKENILSFWIDKVQDHENGGFYGLVDNFGVPDTKFFKGCVLNSRILWTFSKMYIFSKNDLYLKCAKRAFEFLVDAFYDKEFSGLFWTVTYDGKIKDSRKQIYNLAFGIYGLTEYYKATKDKKSLDLAIEIFNTIERFAYDKENGGYIEALKRDYSGMSDLRLSPKDMNEKKSMNTHLHILEAYTNLIGIWKNKEIIEKQRELIEIFIKKIYDNNNKSQKLFFDENWNSKTNIISYGHDIEFSWLLYEAAEVIGDDDIIKKIKDISIEVSENVLKNGIDKNGGIFNENINGKIEGNKFWWPQAEAMVGFFNAYQLTKDDKYLDTVFSMWEYIKDKFIDKEYGEWYDTVYESGKSNKHLSKVNPWKCPYHNSRAMIELIERIGNV